MTADALPVAEALSYHIVLPVSEMPHNTAHITWLEE